MTPQEQSKLTGLIKSNKVVIMPTDTIYGIIGLASSPEVIERIYQIKDREHTKPFVVLISDYSQLESLGINLDPDQRNYLETVWPDSISVIMPTNSMEYLHRGKDSLAVRMPNLDWLKEIVDQTGPIVATSANIAGERYSHDIRYITDKFSTLVDYTSAHRTPESNPSKIINIIDKQILR